MVDQRLKSLAFEELAKRSVHRAFPILSRPLSSATVCYTFGAVCSWTQTGRAVFQSERGKSL